MKKYHYFLFVCVLILVSTFSCVKEKDLPAQPVITFEKYINYPRLDSEGNIILNGNGRATIDSADCMIKFTDGDGDIGIDPADTISGNDLIMKYLYKNAAGDYVPYDSRPSTAAMDTLFYTYRVPSITPIGQYKSLEGEIKAKLRIAPIYAPSHRVVRFEIRLIDRAGHISNKIITNEINIP